MCKINLLLATLFFTITVYSQTENEQITTVLNHYIEGTANGQPERLKKAFHEDFNLYFVKNNELEIWSGKHYISNIKPGVINDRKGKIISIDQEGDAAMAKIEIKMPRRNLTFTDYLLLLKLENKWKIIHKSFSKRENEINEAINQF
ncbi:nuclear transport factor 2 family protein [Psychroserpens sp.]|uniref:nuclear transport factor 2 family protein n=1 Tax=Psychroserpens sp. TaxID=2020870 RepID=UPI00385C068F